MDRKLNNRKRTRKIKGIENGMQERMRKESERNDSYICISYLHVLRNKLVNNKHITHRLSLEGMLKKYTIFSFISKTKRTNLFLKGFRKICRYD